MSQIKEYQNNYFWKERLKPYNCMPENYYLHNFISCEFFSPASADSLSLEAE